MARDYNKQVTYLGDGYFEDVGYVAFTTTGLTVEIYTPLSRARLASVTPVSAMTTPEFFYLNETVGTIDGMIDCSALDSLTLTRYTIPISMDGYGDADCITSYNCGGR